MLIFPINELFDSPNAWIICNIISWNGFKLFSLVMCESKWYYTWNFYCCDHHHLVFAINPNSRSTNDHFYYIFLMIIINYFASPAPLKSHVTSAACDLHQMSLSFCIFQHTKLHIYCYHLFISYVDCQQLALPSRPEFDVTSVVIVMALDWKHTVVDYYYYANVFIYI